VPWSLVGIGEFVDQFAHSLYFWFNHVACVLCAVGKDEVAVGVLCLPLIEGADEVGTVGIDGSTATVGESAHPVALVVDVFGVDVVGVDVGEVLSGVQGIGVWVRAGLHRLVRVYSTYRRSFGFSRLTA
jgi:hypothetical protein